MSYCANQKKKLYKLRWGYAKQGNSKKSLKITVLKKLVKVVKINSLKNYM